MTMRLLSRKILMLASALAFSDARAQTIRVEPRPSLVIGGDDAPAAAVFSAVSDVRRLPNGNYFVVDGSTQQIRFFGKDGRFLVQAGGTGRGPSEFVRLAGVVLENDSLRAFDSSQRKIVTFDINGRFASSMPIGSTGSARQSLWLFRLAGYVHGDPIFMASGFDPPTVVLPTRFWDSIPTLRYDRTGKLRDTIGEFAGMDMFSSASQPSADIRFGRFSSGDVLNNRLYMTDGGRLSIRIYEGSRTPKSTIGVDRAPRPVTAADNQVYERAMLARARTPEGRERIVRGFTEIPRAPVKPWISRVRVDDLGNIWAEEYRIYGDTSAAVWHVFAPGGQSLGTVTAPRGFEIKHIGSDFVVGVARDDDDVEVIAVHPLKR